MSHTEVRLTLHLISIPHHPSGRIYRWLHGEIGKMVPYPPSLAKHNQMAPGPLSSIPRVLIPKLFNFTQQNKALKWPNPTFPSLLPNHLLSFKHTPWSGGGGDGGGDSLCVQACLSRYSFIKNRSLEEAR